MQKISTNLIAKTFFLVFCCISFFSAHTQNWNQKANFGGAARDGAAGFAIGNKGYIGSGQISGNVGSTDFWEYDVSTDTWTQKANIGGIPRWDPFYFELNGKGYLGTGLTGSGYVKDFWEFNPDSNIWVQKADYGGAARQGATAFVLNGIAYAGTGYSSIYRSDFWKYDPSLDQWIQIPSFPGGGRSDARAFSLNNRGYVMTGWNGTSKNDVWEFNPDSSVWSQKQNFPGGVRHSGFTFAIGDIGYYGAGRNYLSTEFNDFWQYNAVTDSWSQENNFPGFTTSYSVAFSIGAKGYVGTGWDSLNSYHNEFYEFSPCNLSISLTINGITCNNNLGSIQTQVGGGTTPYSYIWSDANTNPDRTGLSVGYYSLTVTDVNGCTATQLAYINATAAPTVVINSVNATCYGASDGSAIATVSGGTSPYFYNWSNGANGFDENNLSSGTYSLTVTDANGCQVINTVVISQPAQILSTSDFTICQGDSLLLGATYQSTSGTYYDSLFSANGCDSILVYNLTVTDPVTSYVNAVICPGDSLFAGGAYQTVGGTYTDVFTAASGCDSIVETYLIVNLYSNVISGIVYFEGNPIISGVVKLIQKNGNSPQSMIDIDSMMVNADGSFEFTGIAPGNYLLKALGDTSIYKNVATYSDSTNHWQNASVISLGQGCGDTISLANIHLINFPTTIGFGNIDGTIINGGPGKKAGIMGDPIPGIDVSLEQVPNGIVVGFTKTNSLGQFSFENIELGDYRLYVDIPGFVMDTISLISYDSTNILSDFEVSVCVYEDSASSQIQVCGLAYVGIAEVSELMDFTVYPNPASAKTFVNLNSSKQQNVSLELVNYLGQLMEEKAVVLNEGINKFEIDVKDFSNGIYFLQIKSEEQTIQHKLLINH